MSQQLITLADHFEHIFPAAQTPPDSDIRAIIEHWFTAGAVAGIKLYTHCDTKEQIDQLITEVTEGVQKIGYFHAKTTVDTLLRRIQEGAH